MKTYKEIYQEAYQKELLNYHGYNGPYRGADEHNTFVKDEHRSILIDLSGNEWHYILDGTIVQTVGKLDDRSLGKFLAGKPVVSEDSDDDKPELKKARIYEPGEGSQSISGGE